MSIELAARILHSGGLVVFPTERAPLGSAATRPAAVVATVNAAFVLLLVRTGI